MKSKTFALIAGMLFSYFSYSQDVKKNIEDIIKSPSAKENAAKADVYHHQKAMKDSVNLIEKRSITSKKSKGKYCSKKRSKSS